MPQGHQAQGRRQLHRLAARSNTSRRDPDSPRPVPARGLQRGDDSRNETFAAITPATASETLSARHPTTTPVERRLSQSTRVTGPMPSHAASGDVNSRQRWCKRSAPQQSLPAEPGHTANQERVSSAAATDVADKVRKRRTSCARHPEIGDKPPPDTGEQSRRPVTLTLIELGKMAPSKWIRQRRL